MLKKLIILDRDGVINQESTEFIKTPEEWIPLKGSLEAIGRLSQAGFDIVVITNQSGVGRDLFNADMLGRIHTRMIDHVQQHGGKIQGVLFCPHTAEDECECRKPKTGMYEDLARRLKGSITGVYSVGDSLRDLQAAHSAGATPVLVKTGNGRKTRQQLDNGEAPELNNCLEFQDLAKFTDALLNNELA